MVSSNRREDEQPTKSSMICKCHFQDGDTKKLPTLFAYNRKNPKYRSSATSRASKQVACRRECGKPIPVLIDNRQEEQNYEDRICELNQETMQLKQQLRDSEEKKKQIFC